ncbi:MAG: hypothetical protein P0S94_03990 [Simkaniaceae bacterium]|nr:hypothetical protein [Simkaniaceae bacterium]
MSLVSNKHNIDVQPGSVAPFMIDHAQKERMGNCGECCALTVIAVACAFFACMK